jgi:hypothetical protein
MGSELAYTVLAIGVSIAIVATAMHWYLNGVNPAEFLSNISEVHYTLFGIAVGLILMYALLA